ncbi:hypothetical protein [Intestinibacter bartlettii]|uniref:hypothetical protein n=1 Tax=Intestinibacter bartlettii TaxID=261299 RepID=UPI00319E37C2
MSKTENIRDQVIGNITDIINKIRINDMNDSILTQENNLQEAMGYVESVRDFLSTPENILGSDKTKFGEIAEQVEVGIRNAKDALNGDAIKATFDGVGRTAPEDYIIDGVQVQSKFINGINNNLRHILEHMDKYKGFSDNGYYQIPKDNFDILNKINNGEFVEGLHSRTIESAKSLIKQIERESGNSFNEVVKPSISSYGDVQIYRVNETLDIHESELRKQANENEMKIISEYQPSFQEALKVGAIGVVVGGGFKAASTIYSKCKNEDKKILEFSSEDWKDVGIDFAKGGCKGGINGIAIYGLTNFTNLSAPLASAFVSATWGVSSLIVKYKKGEITLEELSQQGRVVCLETGAVALGSIIGQTLIPIPVVGTLIGSLAAQTLVSITKDQLGNKEEKLRSMLLQEYNNTIEKMDKAYKASIKKIMAQFEKLGGLLDMAFDFEANSKFRFDASIKFAREIKVEEHEILKDIKDVDDFFLN